MAKLKLIPQILEVTSKLKTKNEKVTYLRTYGQHPAFRDMMRIAFNENIVFDLPEGAPPYTPAKNPGSTLYRQYNKLGRFLPGNGIARLKRETLFVKFLEVLDPVEAEFFVSIKDKKMPFKGITRTLINDAFPGILPQ